MTSSDAPKSETEKKDDTGAKLYLKLQDGLSVVLWGIIIYNTGEIVYDFIKKYLENTGGS